MSLACRCTWAPRGENRMSLSKKITCHWHADALGLLEVRTGRLFPRSGFGYFEKTIIIQKH
eukprot:1138385-Pelagomonas_calceolata.AAC.4